MQFQLTLICICLLDCSVHHRSLNVQGIKTHVHDHWMWNVLKTRHWLNVEVAQNSHPGPNQVILIVETFIFFFLIVSFSCPPCQTLVRLLSGSKPLLYSYQTSLPHLPVPPIKDTLEKVSQYIMY